MAQQTSSKKRSIEKEEIIDKKRTKRDASENECIENDDEEIEEVECHCDEEDECHCHEKLTKSQITWKKWKNKRDGTRKCLVCGILYNITVFPFAGCFVCRDKKCKEQLRIWKKERV